MDNLLLPLTLISSGCAWPFASMRAKSQGKGLIGFFPAYAPYIFCDAEKAGGESSAATQQGRPHTPAPKVEPEKKGKLATLADKAGFEFNVNGRGARLHTGVQDHHDADEPYRAAERMGQVPDE